MYNESIPNFAINYSNYSYMLEVTSPTTAKINIGMLISDVATQIDHLVAILFLMIMVYFLLKIYIVPFSMKGLEGSVLTALIPYDSAKTFINWILDRLETLALFSSIYLVYVAIEQRIYNYFNYFIIFFMGFLMFIILLSDIVGFVRSKLVKKKYA